MDQTLPIPMSVKIRQNIAAWLLVFTDLFGMAATATSMFGVNLTVFSFYVSVVYILAWILLCTTASNKATRIASIILLASSLVNLILPFMPVDSPSSILVCNIFLSIKPLISIYAYSLILNGNDNINAKDRSWLGYIIVAGIGLFMVQLFYIVYTLLYPFGDYDYQFHLQYFFSYGFGWNIWKIVYYILLLVAEFRIAKSPAFAGRYISAPAPKGTYSPLNKYFAAALIASAIVVGLLYVIYSNLHSIENIF